MNETTHHSLPLIWPYLSPDAKALVRAILAEAETTFGIAPKFEALDASFYVSPYSGAHSLDLSGNIQVPYETILDSSSPEISGTRISQLHFLILSQGKLKAELSLTIYAEIPEAELLLLEKLGKIHRTIVC